MYGDIGEVSHPELVRGRGRDFCGVCVDSLCRSGCDASACEACSGGACESLCEAGEECVQGACVSARSCDDDAECYAQVHYCDVEASRCRDARNLGCEAAGPDTWVSSGPIIHSPSQAGGEGGQFCNSTGCEDGYLECSFYFSIYDPQGDLELAEFTSLQVEVSGGFPHTALPGGAGRGYFSYCFPADGEIAGSLIVVDKAGHTSNRLCFRGSK